VIQRRLVNASREISEYDKYDYVLINDKLEIACEKLRAIVLSERLRRSPLPHSEDDKKKIELAECCRLANVRAKVQPILASFRGEGPPAHL
jgi:guanylate kinase